MKLKLNMPMKILTAIKKCLVFSNYFIKKSKYNDDSNNLFIGKVKNKTGGMPIEIFVRLKSKIY